MSVRRSQDIRREQTPKIHPAGVNAQYSKDGQEGACEKPKFAKDLERDFAAGDNDRDSRDEDQEARRFPIQCLPPVLRAMAEAISASYRVPLELSGPAVLGIVSGAVGKGLNLKSGADRIIRGNLYLVGIAESGEGKSSTLKEAAQPIQTAEKDALGFWKEISNPETKAEIRILDREIKALEAVLGAKGSKKTVVVDRAKLKAELCEKIARLEYFQEKLEAPRMIVEDVTQEKLGSLLARNSEQLFSLSSDAGKTLQNLEGRYIKEKGKSDDDIYVRSYTGERCLVDRIGRESVILEDPCVALFWLMQPKRAQRLLGNEDLRDGGFLPRCLIWDSQTEPTEEPEQEIPIPPEVRQAYHDLVKELLLTYHDGIGGTIPDCGAARKAIRQYKNRLVSRRRRDLRDINSFVVRWSEQAWRILVVLHASAHGERAHLTQIDAQEPDNAIELAEWFARQQVRLLAAMRDSADQEELTKLVALVSQRYKARATIRDLERRHSYRKEELERLALKFPKKIAIRHEVSGSQGGRPSEILVICSTKNEEVSQVSQVLA